MSMKISVSNFAWSMQNNALVYEEMERTGIRGLEFAPSKLFGEDPFSEEKTRQAVEYFNGIYQTYGIRPVSVQSIWSGCKEQLLGSGEERLRLRKQTQRVIEYAASLACPIIMWGSGACRSRSDYTPKEQVEVAKEFFLPLADYAGERGVTIAVEAVNAYYGSCFLTNSIETLDFVWECHHDALRFNFDTGIMQMEGEELKDFENWQREQDVDDWLSLVIHIHVSAPKLAAVTKQEYQQQLAKLLWEQNYSGYISLEMGDAGIPALYSSMEVMQQFL